MASVSLLLSLLHWLFEMTDAFAERLAEHAPEVVDVYETIAEWKNGRYKLVYATVPEPLFPNFHDCDDNLLQRRKHYFNSMFLQVGCLCLLFGVILTLVRNKVRQHLDGNGSYREVANSESTEVVQQERRSTSLLQCLIGHKVVLMIIIYTHMAVQASVAYFCVVRNTMNDKMGVGYEFWFVFVGMHISGCFTELVLSVFRPGQLGLTAFPQKLVITALPFISEKVDTAKDVVLAAVAYSHGQAVCAALYMLVLVSSQTFFIFCKEVRAELVETYLPILTAPMKMKQSDDDDTKPWVERLITFVRNELQLLLLKQSTPARRIISLGEDLPQALLSVFLAVVSHASWFCLVSVAMGIVRLVLASPWAAKRIRQACLEGVHERRVLAVRSANKDLAVDLTVQLWEVDGENLEKAVHREDPFILRTLVSMIEDDAQLLKMEALTSADCGVLLLLATLGEQRESYIDRIKELRELIEGGTTPMHLAALIGCTSSLEKLKIVGADMTAKDQSGFTPMHFAVIWGHASAVDTLERLGADLSQTDKDGRTPLHGAAREGQEASIQALKEAGADVDARDFEGLAPLHFAAAFAHTNIISALKTLGADMTAKDKSGVTPMHFAVIWGQASAVDTLENFGITVETIDGETPMHRAARCGCTSAIGLLKKAGADINAKGLEGSTPLHRAASFGHAAVIPRLKRLGAEINAADEKGRSPMHEAAKGGHGKVIQQLKKAGADINQKDLEGLSPVHLAVALGHTTVVSTLKTVGADMAAQDKSGFTTMHFAVIWKHQSLVNTLKKIGVAELDSYPEIHGATPTHRAASAGCVSAIGLLKEFGADISAKDNVGYTAMHLAAKSRHLECIIKLKELGLSVNAKANAGETPLHFAASHSHGKAGRACIEKLKELGANLHARDMDGQTPLDYATPTTPFGFNNSKIKAMLGGSPPSSSASSTPRSSIYFSEPSE
eukprot:TRINITY_DN6100_c0_g2_i9.p1 TRINITY_DN6100_c0_g2~~TRINITY_DN6100_c0_g2_i9.p1  ORF type:complete len:979 (-),score=173.76 TRINITY_DN6100_c0_g2_i9:395-3262(-)